MKVEVALATARESETVASLMQLYLYEFPYVDDLEVGDDGRFTYHYFDRYWSEEGRYPFLIRAEQRLSGFAFVVERAVLEPATAGHAMAEFFVLRKFRRRGVGRAAAYALFERFPGPWWVAEHIRNEPAQAFWRSVIGHYTGGIFSEDVTTYFGEPAVVQTFDSPRI
jgi:predicted acetyltransferase